MRILIFSSMQYDHDTGSPIRGRMIREGLAELGAKVAVCSYCPDSTKKFPYHYYNFSDFATPAECLHAAIDDFKPDILLVITIGLLDIVAAVSKKCNLPFVIDVHGLRTVELFSENMLLRDKIHQFISAVSWENSIRKANFVIAANPVLGDWLNRILPRVATVAGIVNDSFFSMPPATATGAKIRFLYSGNFLKYQGIDCLLQAISMLPSMFFDDVVFTLQGTFLGQAEEHHYLKKNLDMQRIELVSPVAFQEYPSFLSQYHVSAIPRPWSFATYLAFPQKLAEGLACGRYVIASDIAPHRYAIAHGIDGVLYANGVRGLRKALLDAPNLLSAGSIPANAQLKAHRYEQRRQCKRILTILENCI